MNTPIVRDANEADRIRREQAAAKIPATVAAPPADTPERMAARVGGGSLELCRFLFRLQALLSVIEARQAALDTQLAKTELK